MLIPSSSLLALAALTNVVSGLPASSQDLFSPTTQNIFAGDQSPDTSNSTYNNPVLPGWHSDPSCVHVDGITYCATSTFKSFPGLPIYASKDLVHWEHISNGWNREEQLPGINFEMQAQQAAFFAPNLRYHQGEFYLTCVFAGVNTISNLMGTIFKTSNIYNDEAWNVPFTWDGAYRTIDPDLFFDDDGTTYLTWSGTTQQTIDLNSGTLGELYSIWNGTGAVFPEGPHIYKKDGYYYLLVAEGGTQLGHQAALGRSKNIRGPYESDPAGVLVTAINSTSLFQTVGHADLFQDSNGYWWGIALGTRSGPEYSHFPMGREANLFPVTWNKGEFPYATKVSGIMNGWPRAEANLQKSSPENTYVGASQYVTFESGSKIPRNFMYFRYPPRNAFSVSAPGHENSLQVNPLRSNLTGEQSNTDSALTGVAGLSFVARRQEHTLFHFKIRICLETKQIGVEAGATMFLQQSQHLDLGVVRTSDESNAYDLVFRTTNATSTEERIPIATSKWSQDKDKVDVSVNAVNTTHYLLAATVNNDGGNGPSYHRYMSSALVSSTWGDQAGSGAGGQVGIYATTNGGASTGDNAYFSNWDYRGFAQEVDFGTFYADVYP